MHARLVLPWFAVAITLPIATPAPAAVDTPDHFSHETVVNGLDEPLGMGFVPDGRLLVVEQRTGKVRMVVNGRIAATDPVLTLPSLNASGYERGLQGVAVDPRWPQHPYVYFIHNRTGGSYLRLVRYTASGDVTQPAGENLTLGSPLILLDDMPDVNHNHNGGTVRFGSDGYLYVSVGDDADNCAAQDSSRLLASVLKLDVTRLPTGGGGPVSKSLLIPAVTALSTSNTNARLVHAYGLRNPWRFHIDPATNFIYLGDVGEGTYEELSEIEAGDNLGWPFREGTQVRWPNGCSEPGGSGTGAYRPPLVTLHHNTGVAAVLSAGVYRAVSGGSHNFPVAYVGDVFYSDYFRGFIRRLKKTNGVWATPPAVPGQANSSDWVTGLNSPVDFAIGPDGALWYLSQWNGSGSGSPRSGSVGRIRYVGPTASVPGAGGAPALRASPNPFARRVELSFALDRAGAARAAVYDARGRRVRRLLDAALPAGPHRLEWDGRGDRGEALPPGIFFVRLDRPGSVETLRLLRLQ